ncbi:hypothetical protein PLICRDRAFT_178085 [Plicaturopsis crispa FD-325 SS-3]|nr:hypothetical protein PLICRDRAFT_178085 [Plicaturopsis crispa FD-325 SS-3]
MPSLPLPREDDPVLEKLGDTPKSAYITYILPAEDDASAATDARRLTNIRILGGLLIYAPTSKACECVAREILSAISIDTDRRDALDRLNRLGQLYFDHFIRVFKKYKSRTPIPSDHPSRPSYNEQRALIQTPQNHSSAKQNALIRDGFRCMLTGKIDQSVFVSNSSVFPDPHEMFTTTNCCHIMPEATNTFNDVKDPDLEASSIEWASRVWTILERFGYGDIRKELEGTAAHWLGNILTLDASVHDLLDNLNLWLEKVSGQDHTYYVRTYPPRLRTGYSIPETVHFTVHDTDVPGFPRPYVEHLPLPSPRYLELHAACCKVAHMSGAAEYLDEVMRDIESIGVLAEDGGSADVLVQAMISRFCKRFTPIEYARFARNYAPRPPLAQPVPHQPTAQFLAPQSHLTVNEDGKTCALVIDLMDPATREGALLELSKKREQYDDLALVLWHAFGIMPALLQEIVSVYPLLSPPNLTAHILLDETGLTYICHTYERFYAVGTVLSNMVAQLVETQAVRLLKHVVRCYLRLSDNLRVAREALRACLPEPLRDQTFSVLLKGDMVTKRCLTTLLNNLNDQ